MKIITKMLITTSILVSTFNYTYAEDKNNVTHPTLVDTIEKQAEKDSHLKTVFDKLVKKMESHNFSRKNNGEEWKQVIHNLAESAHQIIQSEHSRQTEDTKKIMQKHKKDLHELTLLNLDLSSEHKEKALDFSHANFSKSILQNANMQNSNLRHANFKDADLTGANFQGADLREADLTNANLRGSNLKNVDLRNTNLTGVNLQRADLSGSKFKGATMRDANVQGANLSNMTKED